MCLYRFDRETIFMEELASGTLPSETWRVIFGRPPIHLRALLTLLKSREEGFAQKLVVID